MGKRRTAEDFGDNEWCGHYECETAYNELPDAIGACDENDNDWRANLKVLKVLRKCYKELFQNGVIGGDEFNTMVTARLDDVIKKAKRGNITADNVDDQLELFYRFCDDRDIIYD